MKRPLDRFALLALHTLIWTLPLGLGLSLVLGGLELETLGISPFLASFEKPSVSQGFYLELAAGVFAVLYFGGSLALLVVRAAAQGRLSGEFHLPRSPILYAAAAFGGAALLSSLPSPSPLHTVKETAYLWAGIILLAMVIHARPGRTATRRLLLSFVLAAAATGLVGVLQYRGINLHTGGLTVPEVNGGRYSVRSLLGHPNFLAGFVGPVLMLCPGLLVAARTLWLRIVLAVAAGILAVCVVVTGSRSIWLATLVVGGAMLIVSLPALRRIRFGRATWLGLAAIVLAVALFAVPNPLIPRRYSFTKRLMSPRPVASRQYFYVAACHMIMRNPILGIGYNNFDMAFWKHAAALQSEPENQVFGYVLEDLGGVRPDRVHNEYLQIAAETGVLGIGSFLLLVVLFFSTTRETHRALRSPGEKLVVTGMAGAVAVVLIDSLFSFPLHLPSSTLVFWLILGFGSWYGYAESVEFEQTSEVRKEERKSNDGIQTTSKDPPGPMKRRRKGKRKF